MLVSKVTSVSVWCVGSRTWTEGTCLEDTVRVGESTMFLKRTVKMLVVQLQAAILTASP